MFLVRIRVFVIVRLEAQGWTECPQNIGYRLKRSSKCSGGQYAARPIILKWFECWKYYSSTHFVCFYLFIYLLWVFFLLLSRECSLVELRQPAWWCQQSVFVQCVPLDSLCFGLTPLTAMCRISGISLQLISLTFLIETLALSPFYTR